MGDRKDPSLNAAHLKRLLEMQARPENKLCADCHGKAPRWASTNLGCFLCIACSGIHRNMGTHISVVRSTTLDTWTPNQVAFFTTQGNTKSAAVYEAHLPKDFIRPNPSDGPGMERFLRDKYEHKVYAPLDKGGLAGRAPPRASPRRAPTSNPLSPPRRRDPGYHAHISPRLGAADRGSAVAPAPLASPRRRAAASPRRRGDALKALLDMGFSPHAAVDAVAASNGNLQRAVEWLLVNDPGARDVARSPQLGAVGVASPAAEARRTSPAPARGTEPSIGDLLSFEKDTLSLGAPAMAARDAAAEPPAGAAGAAHKETAVAAPPAWAKAGADDDDFADFGAFASALPASDAQPSSGAASKPAAASAAAVPSGSSAPSLSLAALYADGAWTSPAAAGGPSPGGPIASRKPLPALGTASALSPSTTQPAAISTEATSSREGHLPASPTKLSPANQSPNVEAGPTQPAVPSPAKEPEDPFASLASFAMSSSFKASKAKSEAPKVPADKSGSAKSPSKVTPAVLPQKAAAVVDDGFADLISTGVAAPSLNASTPSGANAAAVSLEDLLG